MLGKQFRQQQCDCRNLSRKEGMFSFRSLYVIHVSLSRHNLCCFRVAQFLERLKPFSSFCPLRELGFYRFKGCRFFGELIKQETTILLISTEFRITSNRSPIKKAHFVFEHSTCFWINVFYHPLSVPSFVERASDDEEKSEFQTAFDNRKSSSKEKNMLSQAP